MGVPFNRAHTTGAELRNIAAAIEATQLAGNGPFAALCSRWLGDRTGAKVVLLTHSCTGALELAALLAEIGPGDEVIMPSFTFTSTANAVVLRGGKPVFVDIREDTLNIDEELVEAAITPRTKAIAPVHYAGVGAEMDGLLAIAAKYELTVLEDAAQGLVASYRGRELGSFGHAAALSFHETKNVMCGEGGALLVNHEPWVERAEIIYEKGTDRSRFFRGQVDKYSWVDVGSSFPLSELGAAFLWGQLDAADQITARRLEIWDAYHARLAELEDEGFLRRPIVPGECRHNAHMYYVLVAGDRDAFIDALGARGVNAVTHYVPLHSSAAGLRFASTSGDLDVTDRVSAKLVRLPLWMGMTGADVEHVVAAVEAAVRVPAAKLN